MFKSCLDNFIGSNVENVAWLLEGCGRYLLRSEATHEPFAKMVRMKCVFVCLGAELFVVGVDEAKAGYAALRPATISAFRECLLSGW